MTGTQTSIPLAQAPFLGPNGRVTEPWWRFLLTLYNRTGQSEGGDLTIVKDDVADLQVDVNTFSFGQATAVLAQGHAESQQFDLGAASASQQIAALAARVAELEQQAASLGPMLSASNDLPPDVPALHCCAPDEPLMVFVHSVYTQPDLHAVATPSSAGFMSAADKTKLDSL
jgi:hypothetical protein